MGVLRSKAEGRALAALLRRELTNFSLASLSKMFTLDYPNSAANLVRKAKQDNNEDPKARKIYIKTKDEIVKNE